MYQGSLCRLLVTTTMMMTMFCTTTEQEADAAPHLLNGSVASQNEMPTPSTSIGSTHPSPQKSIHFALMANVTASSQLDASDLEIDGDYTTSTSVTNATSRSDDSGSRRGTENVARVSQHVPQIEPSKPVDAKAATEKSVLTTMNTNGHHHSWQRISAVRIDHDSVGEGWRGAAKNTKIELPAGLNYVFDTQNKHRHHDYRKYGPLFETGNVTNITVQAGNTFYLNCKISLLLDKTVSWVHRRMGQNELQLLTVGKQTYSGDPRFIIDFQYPNNWRLRIESVMKEDEGVYECQISTHPPRVITYHIRVNDPKILIVDEAGSPLLDKYVQVDSTIKLTCIVRHISMTSSVVYWLHGDTILNHDTTRGGISVKTELKNVGANSTLFVAKVNQSDSGNYTCSIGLNQHYAVMVHVLNESLAELHHSSLGVRPCHHNVPHCHPLLATALTVVMIFFWMSTPR